MARAAIVLSILISSPSDVLAECATVKTAINDWNSSYSQQLGIFLESVQWQTHAFPESGDRPQALINKQIVDESDMVISVFGHRIGTSTGTARSGTIEEIERLRKNGKHVAVYFSEAPIPHDHDPEQFRLVQEYREGLKRDTLYWTFKSTEELYKLVLQHIARSVPRIYQNLTATGTIRVLASQLPGMVAGSATAEAKPAAPAKPFSLSHEFLGEFPSGPYLELKSDAVFEVARLEYLDENGTRIAIQQESKKGVVASLHIDQTKLVQIHNLKPRGNEGIPMQFRVHLVVNGGEETRTIPAVLMGSMKVINNIHQYFMKVLG